MGDCCLISVIDVVGKLLFEIIHNCRNNLFKALQGRLGQPSSMVRVKRNGSELGFGRIMAQRNVAGYIKEKRNRLKCANSRVTQTETLLQLRAAYSLEILQTFLQELGLLGPLFRREICTSTIIGRPKVHGI